MTLMVKDLVARLDVMAPPHLALPGDIVGLELGDPRSIVKRVRLALDVSEDVVCAACEGELLIAHHPLFFTPPTAIVENEPLGALVAKAVRKKLHIYSLHSNYDRAPDGVSQALGRALSLPLLEACPLQEDGVENWLKLVVFVPVGHEDRMREELSKAGAGQLGRYSACTFQTPGTGTFRAEDGASPFVGELGQLEKVSELRLETILPVSRQKAVLAAMHSAHPYEEVAYDLYPLVRPRTPVGLGLFTVLDEPVSLEDLLQACAGLLPGGGLRYTGRANTCYRRVALCGGSGGTMIAPALARGAEILISGDFRYHDWEKAAAGGLDLIDAGHSATEWPAIVALRDRLQEWLNKEGQSLELILHPPLAPWSIMP